MLTPRWYPLRPHALQQEYFHSPYRFIVLPCGRRSGKSEMAKRRLVYRALRGSDFMSPRFFAAAPTREQSKRIFWDDLKAMIPPGLIQKVSESELTIKMVHGVEIVVLGMDKPERIEGTSWDGGVVDEYANMKAHAWTAHIRPALADRRGWCDLIGVPEGRNHYHELWVRAVQDMKEMGAESEWGGYTWKSSDILSKQEIDGARRDMDELTFQQEFEASFVNFEGRCYYPFLMETHCAKLQYNPKATLVFTFDFNVQPGSAAVIQEQKLPNGLDGTGVINEVWIPNNSNTPAVCRKLIEMYGNHQGNVVCYGDATGGARGSSKIMGSDWDLIRAELMPVFGGRLMFKVPPSNPAERARINAVNTRLKNGADEVRMMIDPIRASKVVRDMEGVKLLAGGSGEIDKQYDPTLTHISDGIGYYISREFPIMDRKVRLGSITGH